MLFSCRSFDRCLLLLVAAVTVSARTSWGATDPTVPGVVNFHQVDEHVYRGAQPTEAGLRNLAKLGIKTVVDLRMEAQQSDREEQRVEALGMRYVHVPLHRLKAPTNEEVEKALAVLNDPKAWPVFVHCAGGRDRTGTVVACYRISHEHWSNEKALEEARKYGIRSEEAAKQKYIQSYKPPERKPENQAAGAAAAGPTE